MAPKALLICLSAVMLSGGCASSPPAVARPASPDVATIIELEDRLTWSLLRGHRNQVGSTIAPDFSCTMLSKKGITSPSGGRYHLCTGMGHDLSRRAPRPRWLVNAERATPRSAEIESIDVVLDNGTATAISTQVYRNWRPYDGSFVRRSRVIDTWVRRDGEWKLLHRATEPLDESGSVAEAIAKAELPLIADSSLQSAQRPE